MQNNTLQQYKMPFFIVLEEYNMLSPESVIILVWLSWLRPRRGRMSHSRRVRVLMHPFNIMKNAWFKVVSCYLSGTLGGSMFLYGIQHGNKENTTEQVMD